MSDQNQLSVIILAAGKGTRMASPLPKVLHPVAGVPMISRVVNSVKSAGAKDIRVVVGYGDKLVKQVVEPMGCGSFKQSQQLGTADAVKAADIDSLDGTVLIINGDHPLISKNDIQKLWRQHRENQSDISVVSVKLKNPKKFGRIVRHKGEIRAIVEAKDASHETLKINEVNTGIYFVKADVLQEYLPLIKNHNAQKEYYLTDLISLAIENQDKVGVIEANTRVAFGVNDQMELAKATSYIYKQNCKRLMKSGVMILDPNNTYIDETVNVGAATVIYPGSFLKGSTNIGTYCVVEPNCYIVNSSISDSVVIHTFSHLEDCLIDKECFIGPYARIRPGSEIKQGAKVGNFVELKKVKFGKGSKASHLTYLGDAEIGEDVNIGCGTITCNYAVDKKKYITKIEDGVFVGSDTQFVAPVTVGKNAIIGSGSTITKDVPGEALAVARGKQVIKENYSQKIKKDKKD